MSGVVQKQVLFNSIAMVSAYLRQRRTLLAERNASMMKSTIPFSIATADILSADHR
jgi:hypothetical protein